MPSHDGSSMPSQDGLGVDEHASQRMLQPSSSPVATRTRGRLGWPSGTRRIGLHTDGFLVIAIIVVGFLIALGNRRFLTSANIFDTLQTASIIGIVAIGEAFVIISGEIDLAVGAMVAFGSCSAFVLATSIPWELAAFLGVASGLVSGFLVGILTTKLGINSFIVTLALLSVASGLAYLITAGLPVFGLNQLAKLGQGRVIGPIYGQVIIFAVLAGAGQWLLTRTVFGRYVLAVGGSPEAARLAGIPVHRVKILCLIMVGFLSTFAGLVQATQFSTATPTPDPTFNLNVIAAVIIGGTALTGGKGSIYGSVLGAILLAEIDSAFVLLNLSAYLEILSTGVVVLIAVTIDVVRQRLASGVWSLPHFLRPFRARPSYDYSRG